MKKKRVTSKRSSRATEKSRTAGKTEEKLPKNNRNSSSSGPSLPRNSARPHPDVPDASRNRDLEDKYRLIFQHSPIGIIYFDRTGQVTDCNDRFVEIIGAPRKDILAFSLVRSLKDPQMKEAAAAALQGRSGHFVGQYASALSGKKMTVRVVFGPLVSHDGAVTGGIGIFEDITAHKAIETALSEEKNKSEAIIAAIGDGISVQDTDFNIVYQNDVHKKIMGDHVGEFCYRAYRRQERVCGDCPTALAFQDGKIHTMEFSSPREDGTVHVEVTASPLRDASGSIIAGIEVVRDITERKRAEKSLLLFRNLLDRSSEAIFVNDPKTGRFLFVNDKACANLGYTRDELLAKGVLDIESIFPDRSAWEAHVREVKSKGHLVLEGMNKRRDGSLFPVEASVAYVTLGGVNYMIAAIRDITERKRVEAELRKSEERLSRAQKLAHVGHWEKNLVTGHLHWSGEIYRIYGVDPAQFTPTTEAFLNAIYPDDREPLVEALKAAVSGRKNLDIDYRLVRSDGSIRTVHTLGEVTFDPTGKPLIHSGTIQDITERKAAEETFRETNARLQALIQTIPDMVVFKDLTGRHVIVNRAVEEVTGHGADEIVGKTVEELLPPGPAAACRKSDEEAMKQSGPSHAEERIVRKDGQEAVFDMVKAPMVDHRNTVIGLIAVGRDITERKRVDEALRESERFLQTIIDTEPECVKTLGPGGLLLTMNDAGLSMIGAKSLDEVKGKSVYPLVAPEHRGAFEKLTEDVFRGKSGNLEFEMIGFHGRRLWLDTNAVPLRNERNEIIALLAVTRDITERKLTEEVLRESEGRYRDLFENANDPIFILDADQRYIDVNRRAVETFGYSKDEFLAMSVFDIIPPEQVERSKAEFKKLAEAGKYEKFIGKVRAKDGRWLIVEVSSSAILKDGKCVGSRDIVRDITERVRRAKDLERSKELLAKAEKIARLGSWEWDIATNTLTWSDEVYRLYGMSPGRDRPTFDAVVDTLHPDCRDRFLGAVNSAVTTGQPFEDEYCLIRRDGSIRFTYTKGEVIRDHGGKPEKMLGVVQDITDRKQAEAFVRNILETVDEGFIVIDRNYRILSANKAYCNQAGKPSEEIIGKKCYETSHGLTRPCFEVGEACAVRRTFETGHPAAELHTHYDDKKNPIYVEIKSFPVKDAMGKMTAAIEIVNNVSEKKKLEDQLRHAQKMEAVGLLAGGVAHDFNNILTAIIGYGNLLEMKLPQDDPLRMYVDQILASSARAANLTQSLLAFSRKQVINPRPVDVNEIIVRIEKLLRRVIGEDIELRTDLKPGALTVVADMSQIEQVLMNLATNARDAMPEGGTLTIKTDSAAIDEATWRANGFGKGGAYVTVAVSDTGVGMDEKTRQRIFEPFFTTKELGRGTGLGLAIVYGIMKQNNGYVTVKSEVGKGSSFNLFFPLTGGSAEREAEAEPVRGMLRGSGTVLLAEDDTAVRQLIRNTLSEFGYAVIEAVDGEDAVGKFMEHRDRIQLLILDVIMPNKNGREAYHAIRTVRPDIPTIFISGYSDDIISRRVLVDDRCHFVAKPVSPQDLLAKIQSILA